MDLRQRGLECAKGNQFHAAGGYFTCNDGHHERRPHTCFEPARSARPRAACRSRSRTARSSASAATRTMFFQRASSARKGRRLRSFTRIRIASASQWCGEDSMPMVRRSSSRSSGTRRSPSSPRSSPPSARPTATTPSASTSATPTPTISAGTPTRVAFLKSIGTRSMFSASTVDQMPRHVASGYLYGNGLRMPVPDMDRTDLLVLLGTNPFVSNGSICTAPGYPDRIEAVSARGGRGDRDRPRSDTHRRGRRPAHPHPSRHRRGPARGARPPPDRHRPGLGGGGSRRSSMDSIELRAAVEPFSPDDAAATITGIDADTIRALADELAAACDRSGARPHRHHHRRVRHPHHLG